MGLGLEILVVLLLILLNGLFSMSELALVSARRARLAVLERKGVAGAALARSLAEDPQRFLPTVQVGITLVGILVGVFGGANVAAELTPLLARLSDEIRASLAKTVPHPSRLGAPDEFGRLAVQIIENPMLNGETIRLDGAIRMAPR